MMARRTGPLREPRTSGLFAQFLLASADGQGAAAGSAPMPGIRVSFHDTPLTAECFIDAVSPLAGAGERRAVAHLVGHHEAHLTLRLTPGGQPARDLATLYQATAALAPLHKPLALLWGPTNRLHHGPSLRPLLRLDDPLSLFLAPVIHSLGPRRAPVMRFLGARQRLGFDLALHIGQLTPDQAVAAGLAIARASLADPSICLGGRFIHGDTRFQIVHEATRRIVMLVPTDATGDAPDLAARDAAGVQESPSTAPAPAA